MAEKASLEFRLGKIDETRNYLLGEIKFNDLKIFNSLIMTSITSDCVSFSKLALPSCVPVDIANSVFKLP